MEKVKKKKEKLKQNSSLCKLCSHPYRSESPTARMLWQYGRFYLFDTVIMKIFMVKMQAGHTYKERKGKN